MLAVCTQCEEWHPGAQGRDSSFRYPPPPHALASHAWSSLSLALQELQKYEQFIFADHTNMIHVENVYEEILHQILLDETLKGEGRFTGAGGELWIEGSTPEMGLSAAS